MFTMSARAGAVLRRWRIKAGLSQYDLAPRVGVDQYKVSRWESGRTEPSLTEAFKLEDVSGGEVPARLWKRSERSLRAAKSAGT